ncbi:MAG: molybdopterin cofactor-binding domain-containing protein, partial [Pseudoclavibacter sp.]
IRNGDPLPEADMRWGSYGLDQCLDLAEGALRRGNGVAAPEGANWRVGEGMAVAWLSTLAPNGHISNATATAMPDGTFVVRAGTAEFGNGSTVVLQQIAASVLDVPVSRIALRHADTDLVEHDTGAFASTGITVAGTAVHAACVALLARMREAGIDDGRMRETGGVRGTSELGNGTAGAPAALPPAAIAPEGIPT